MPMPLPAENTATGTVTTLKSGVKILQVLNYPVKSLVFECGEKSTLQGLADATSTACIFLQENNHPYNVLITDMGRRVLLFLQVYLHH